MWNMADPLTLLRDFNVRKQLDQVHLKDGRINFADSYSFESSAFVAFRKAMDGDFYTLEAALFLLRTRALPGPDYVKAASVQKITRPIALVDRRVRRCSTLRQQRMPHQALRCAGQVQAKPGAGQVQARPDATQAQVQSRCNLRPGQARPLQRRAVARRKLVKPRLSLSLETVCVWVDGGGCFGCVHG